MNPTRTQVRSLAGALVHDVRRGLDLAEQLQLGLVDDPHPNLGHNRSLAAAALLVGELTDSLRTAYSLARGHCDDPRVCIQDDSLGRAASLVFALGFSLGASEQDPSRARLMDLGEVLSVADRRVGDLVRSAKTSSMQAVEPAWLSAVSRRMTAWAVGILPAVDRPDYEERFHSELFDLARSGGGRWPQHRYAVRVLVRAPLLRRELRAPVRERSW